MKSLFLSIFFFHSLLSFEYTVEPKKISDEIHCFFGAAEVMDEHNNGNISNSCFVDLGSSYLVIDTGPSYNYARDTYKAMQGIKKQKVSHVMITHIHDDHWLGNGFYKEMGATIIGPEIFANTPKAAKTRMQQRISPQAYAGTQQVYPSTFIKDEKKISLEGVEIELKVYNYDNHSSNDMIIVIAGKDVVFAGDLVFNDRILSLRDGNINHWIETIEEIDAKELSFIIGGHGELYNKEATQKTLAYLRDVKSFVQNAIDEGLDITDTLENSAMPKYEDLKLYEMMHRGNVEKAYRTLEWGDE